MNVVQIVENGICNMKSNREWNFHQIWNSDGDEKILM